MDEEIEISLPDLFRSILRHLPLILAAAILFGAVTWCITSFGITPKYTASAKMISISNPERTQSIYTSAEHNAAVALVNTASEVIKTDIILNEVSEMLAEQGLRYSAASLKKMVTISSVNDTEVFRVTVTGTKQHEVATVANTIAFVAEEQMAVITEAGSAKVLEHAVEPVSQSSPNVLRNTALGALIGLFLCAMFVVIRDLYDTTIWTEEQLTSRYKYPVLGLVPQLSVSEEQSKTKEAKA